MSGAVRRSPEPGSGRRTPGKARARQVAVPVVEPGAGGSSRTGRERWVVPLAAALAGALGPLLGGWALSRGASGEVERSVRAGIQAGVDEALSPQALRERSRAAGLGLVDGVLEAASGGTAPGGTDEPLPPRELLSEGARLAGQGARLAGDAARLAGQAAQLGSDLVAPRAPTRDEPPRRARAPSLDRVAGRALDAGLDALDAFLGPPPPPASRAADRPLAGPRDGDLPPADDPLDALGAERPR